MNGFCPLSETRLRPEWLEPLEKILRTFDLVVSGSTSSYPMGFTKATDACP
jgi:hypothetical protein